MSDERDDPTPPDPAGTQPKVDRDALLPARIEPPPPEPEEEDPQGPLPEPVEGRPLGEPRVVHEAPHAARFQFLLGALLAIGAVAIAGLIWAVGQTRDPEGAAWSPWKPQGQGIEAAREIAAHVGPQYKASDGKQLVLVTASEMKVDDVQLKLVQRQEAESGGEAVRLEGDALIYRFCGMGERCAIRGKPSAARGLLLRREAIEIASYTFRYIPNLEHVVFFLPPGPLKIEGDAVLRDQTVMLGNQVLLFRRDTLEPLLDAPLRSTLKAPPPTPRTVRRSPDAGLVAALASGSNFFYSLSQAESDDSAFLVLDREPQPEQIREAAERSALEQAMSRAAQSAAGRTRTAAADGR